MRPSAIRSVLTIAGSDSGGGAGIQADLRAFAAFGVHGACAITAVTAQDSAHVHGTWPVPPEAVATQVRVVLSDLDVGAVKTGALGNAATVAAVACALRSAPGGRRPLVVDPVLRASDGTALLDPDGCGALVSDLLPLADVLTPNVPEAAEILGEDAAEAGRWSRRQRGEAARALQAMGPRAVLVKGGHLRAEDDMAADVLATATNTLWFEHPWVDAANARGTGCTLSAALAAGLALGLPLEEAVRQARAFLLATLRSARPLAKDGRDGRASD